MIAGQETRANDVPRLEMLLLHTFGNAWRAEWCPHGAYDDVQNQPALPDGVLPRIGLLAVLFDDGCLRVFAVPRPMSVRQNLQIFDLATPVTLLLEPVWTGRMPSKITSFAWSTDAEHRYIAAGCVDGTIAVWDLAMALSGDAAIPQPSLVNTVDGAPVVLHQHNNCVRSIAWMPVQEGSDGPSHLASASQDGRVVIHDLRVPKNTYLMLRSLGFMCDIIWPRSLNAVVWSSPDNTVRWSPTEEDGSQGGVQVLGLHAGTIWVGIVWLGVLQLLVRV